jgi:hypothetical protein
MSEDFFQSDYWLQVRKRLVLLNSLAFVIKRRKFSCDRTIQICLELLKYSDGNYMTSSNITTCNGCGTSYSLDSSKAYDLNDYPGSKWIHVSNRQNYYDFCQKCSGKIVEEVQRCLTGTLPTKMS